MRHSEGLSSCYWPAQPIARPQYRLSEGAVMEKAFYRLSELAGLAGCTEDDVFYFFETYPVALSVSLHGVAPGARTYSWIDGIDRVHSPAPGGVYVPTLDALYELHIDAIRALHRDGQCAITRVFADSGLCTVTLHHALAVDRSMVFVRNAEAAKFLSLHGAKTAGDGADDPPIKRAALVALYGREWEDLESDLRHADENGLRDAAKASKRGFWHPLAALQWAEQRGKLDPPKSGASWPPSI